MFSVECALQCKMNSMQNVSSTDARKKIQGCANSWAVEGESREKGARVGRVLKRAHSILQNASSWVGGCGKGFRNMQLPFSLARSLALFLIVNKTSLSLSLSLPPTPLPPLSVSVCICSIRPLIPPTHTYTHTHSTNTTQAQRRRGNRGEERNQM